MLRIWQKIGAKLKQVPLHVFLVLLVYLILLVAFAVITDEIVFEKETGFDNYAFRELSFVTTPDLTKLMVFFTFFGSQQFLIPAYIVLVLYLLVFKKSSNKSIGIALVALTGIPLLRLMKEIFKRSRPADPLINKIATFSYPSGHSFSAFTLSGILIFLIWTSTDNIWVRSASALLLFVFAVFVAVSRVYLHVHYASDVVAGFCVALLWLLSCFFILKYYFRRRTKGKKATS